MANQFLSQKPRESQRSGVTFRVGGRTDGTGGEAHQAGLGIGGQNLLLGRCRCLKQKSCTVLKNKQHLTVD